MVNALMVDLKAKQHNTSNRGQNEPGRVELKECEIETNCFTKVLARAESSPIKLMVSDGLVDRQIPAQD